MEIINSTMYTFDAIMEFQQFNTRFIKSIRHSAALFYIFILLVVIFDIVTGIIFTNWVLIIGGAVFLVYYVRVVYVKFIAPRRKFDKASFKDIEQKYTFRPKYVLIETGGEEGKLGYDTLHKVYETPNFLYLYLNRNKAYVMDLNGFVQGDMDALRKQLTVTLGAKRYKLIKN